MLVMRNCSTRWKRVSLVRALMVGLCLVIPSAVFASTSGSLAEPANNDVSNVSSLQRGARNYVNYCLGCHSAKYVRYNRLAADLGITEDQLINNLMFVGEKPADTMRISMLSADAQRWFGQTPPDLSLIARSRGTDFLYGFLRSFYIDENQPTGVNNLFMENVSMPHVLWELQGMQQAFFEEETGEDGTTKTVFRNFEIVVPGQMSAEEYDQFVRDLVNFLEYIGEPVQVKRRQLGTWVLIYLLVFGIFAYALKNEIWKDIK